MDTIDEFRSNIIKLMEKQSETMEVHTMLLEKLIMQNQRTQAFLVPKKSVVGTERLVGVLGEHAQPEDKLDIDEFRYQKEATEKMVKALESMEKKLETLEKNSNLDHDDQPSRHHELETYEPAWRGVYETLSTTMKDKVERWKSGMDSSLIFVGLFVTIITAFLIPVSQNLAPNPSDLTNDILTNLTTVICDLAVLNGLKVPNNLARPRPFHPSLSDEIVSLLWYSALLLSLIAAIFSVFGRQWVEHLTKKPDCHKYLEKARRLHLREELANRILKPILDSLHPILILSITLFIAGLLFQLWTVSLTVDKSATLILISIIGSVLVLCATMTIIATVLHSGYCEESPFTISTSAVIRRFIPKRFLQKFKVDCEHKEYFPLFCTSITHMDDRDSYDHASSVRLFGFQWWPEDMKPKSQAMSHAIDSVVHFLRSDASKKAKLTMAWNLLDLESLEETDYEKLRIALLSLEYDFPYEQKQSRLGYTFVRLVLLSRLRKGDVGLSVSADNFYLDKRIMKVTFVAFLAIPEYLDEKSEVAYELVRLIEDDLHFFDDIRSGLCTAILTNDMDNQVRDWREMIIECLPAEVVTELLSRISETSDSIFIFKILRTILYCDEPITLPDNFDLSNSIDFLTSYEHRYTIIPNYHKCPIDIILSFLARMGDALLSRQRDLSDFLWTIAHHDDANQEHSVYYPDILARHRLATSLLDRLVALCE